MTDNTAKNKAALLTIAKAVLEDYFAQLKEPLNADASKELQRILNQLETRKQRLQNPPAPKPRKPRKPKAEVSGADSVVVESLDGDILHRERYVNSKPKTGRQKS